jgi:hypothetical protein
LKHKSSEKTVVFFLKGMKRVLQVVAFALVAVLTAQPAIAGLTCGMTAAPVAACAPACGMAMSQMGAHCPMPHHGTDAGCLQDCCRNGWPQAVVQSASKAKPKAARTQFLQAALSPAPVGMAAFAAPPREEIAAAGPARHILLQVFRI